MIRPESIDVEITSDCNLNCKYCYIGCGTFENSGTMTDETIEKLLDLVEKHGYPKLVKMENGRIIGPTKLTIYGGEPMMAFERVQHLYNRAKTRGMTLDFSLLTNGTLGTPEQVAWLKERNIWAQRSIDGHPEAQEAYRPNSIAAYEEQSKIWKDYESSRRCTVQPEFAKDLLKSQQYFETLGFHRGCAHMPNFYADWSDQQILDFCRSMWDIGRYYLKKWHEGKPFYNYYLSREMYARFGVCRAEQHGCGGGRGLHCVSWDGWVYLCHRFAKKPHDHQACYGHLDELLAGGGKGYGAELAAQVEKNGRRNPQDWREECKNCIAQYSCEKGCMQINLETSGDINKVPKLYCAIRQEAAKVVAWLDSELRAIDSEWWVKGNHLEGARKYKPRTVVSTMMAKAMETMVRRSIDSYDKQRRRR